MGRIVVNADADIVADAVSDDGLRTTFNEKLEGHDRPVEFEDIAGNRVAGYSYMCYKRVWPTAQRDFSVMAFKFKDERGVWWTPNKSVLLPKIIPEVQDRIRAEVIIGGYKIEPWGKVRKGMAWSFDLCEFT